MSRTLNSRSTLDTLKTEAKRWLKALRAGEPQARRRLAAVMPDMPAAPALRDVQFALAREHGLPGWAALRQALDDLALARHSAAERADIMLRSAWGGDLAAARRILARWPETGSHDLYTAVATGQVELVRRRLDAAPAAATAKGGPLDWEPLLYLAYARLPGAEGQGGAIATLLLDRGADATARFDDGWGNAFTVLTGVIGEGEGDRAPHPEAMALAQLLVERGADPFDTQALYNTSITRDETGWLDFLWARSVARGRDAAWRTVGEKPAIGGRVPCNAVDYLLGNAVAFDHPARAAWLLDHGANAAGVHAYSGRRLREEALAHGHVAMAALLERHGAPVLPLSPDAAFVAACMRLDRAEAAALATAHPDVLGRAEVMGNACRLGRADIVALLLDLGMSVDVADDTGVRGLHHAAGNGAIEVVRLLIAHGADIDRPTLHYGGPMGFAAHFRQREVAALLAPLSRDVPHLVALGQTARLAELLAVEPGLVDTPDPKFGTRPLFALPDDEDEAAAMAEFLLGHGADPTVRDDQGRTPADAARQRGLLDAADLLTTEG